MEIINRIGDFLSQTGIAQFFNGEWRNLIMILIGLIFLYLAIKKNFEPYLLIPIAFGIILTNIPNGEIYHLVTNEAGAVIERKGLLAYLHIGVEYEIYPCLIFLGLSFLYCLFFPLQLHYMVAQSYPAFLNQLLYAGF